MQQAIQALERKVAANQAEGDLRGRELAVGEVLADNRDVGRDVKVRQQAANPHAQLHVPAHLHEELLGYPLHERGEPRVLELHLRHRGGQEHPLVHCTLSVSAQRQLRREPLADAFGVCTRELCQRRRHGCGTSELISQHGS